MNQDEFMKIHREVHSRFWALYVAMGHLGFYEESDVVWLEYLTWETLIDYELGR